MIRPEYTSNIFSELKNKIFIITKGDKNKSSEHCSV